LKHIRWDSTKFSYNEWVSKYIERFFRLTATHNTIIKRQITINVELMFDKITRGIMQVVYSFQKSY